MFTLTRISFDKFGKRRHRSVMIMGYITERTETIFSSGTWVMRSSSSHSSPSSSLTCSMMLVPLFGGRSGECESLVKTHEQCRGYIGSWGYGGVYRDDQQLEDRTIMTE